MSNEHLADTVAALKQRIRTAESDGCTVDRNYLYRAHMFIRVNSFIGSERYVGNASSKAYDLRPCRVRQHSIFVCIFVLCNDAKL